MVLIPRNVEKKVLIFLNTFLVLLMMIIDDDRTRERERERYTTTQKMNATFFVFVCLFFLSNFKILKKRLTGLYFRSRTDRHVFLKTR